MPVKEALSALLSKCESCGQRRPYDNRKWCKPCILKWQRSPEREGTEYQGTISDRTPCLDDIISPRYIQADLSDLPKSLVETFLSLPDDKGLLIWGEPGRGKTHSMCAFAKHLWSEGWEVERVTYEMLALYIRDTFKPGSTRTELELFKPLIGVDKLILEDVGTTISIGQQESDFSLRTFLVLLDQRLEHCRATFVTTNKSVEELSKSFDQRIASRLKQSCEIIHLTGDDHREIKRG